MGNVVNLSEYRQKHTTKLNVDLKSEWHTYAVKFWFLKDDGYWDQDVVKVQIQGGKDQHEEAERLVIANYPKKIQVTNVLYQS